MQRRHRPLVAGRLVESWDALLARGSTMINLVLPLSFLRLQAKQLQRRRSRDQRFRWGQMNLHGT